MFKYGPLGFYGILALIVLVDFNTSTVLISFGGAAVLSIFYFTYYKNLVHVFVSGSEIEIKNRKIRKRYSLSDLTSSDTEHLPLINPTKIKLKDSIGYVFIPDSPRRLEYLEKIIKSNKACIGISRGSASRNPIT